MKYKLVAKIRSCKSKGSLAVSSGPINVASRGSFLDWLEGRRVPAHRVGNILDISGD
jgi:hypothetical protein